MLQEGKGELAQERVVVQPTPGAALEVVEAQFVLELLVHLLADPSIAAAIDPSPGEGQAGA